LLKEALSITSEGIERGLETKNRAQEKARLAGIGAARKESVEVDDLTSIRGKKTATRLDGALVGEEGAARDSAVARAKAQKGQDLNNGRVSEVAGGDRRAAGNMRQGKA